MVTKKKITRKVISSFAKKEEPHIKEEIPAAQKTEKVTEQVAEEESSKFTRTKKECSFCQKKSSPSYTDLTNLRRFLTDRAKIVSKERSGACAKHQRAITKNIKYARHLALLAFVPKV